MLVSVKCRASFSHQDAKTACDNMKEKATADKVNRALYLLIVFGSGSRSVSETPNSKFSVEEVSVSDELTRSYGVLSRIIFVPRDDDFGLSKANS